MRVSRTLFRMFAVVGMSILAVGGGSDGTTVTTEGTWLIDANNASGHIAQFAADDGRTVDFWAELDEFGEFDYISTVKSQKDGSGSVSSSGEEDFITSFSF